MKDVARRVGRSLALAVEDGAWTARTLPLRSRLRRAAAEGRSPRSVFAGAADRYWLWANTSGARRFPEVRAMLPELPDERTQRMFSGQAGDDALVDAYRFYRLVKALADRHRPGGFASCRTILEFGSGWGRITRLFLKDRDGDQLRGIDCVAAVVDMARDTNRWARFDLVAPTPPTPLPGGAFDLVYCYSVFSHLSEESHQQWLAEFRRLLVPGGLLVATTRPRQFFLTCVQQREALAAGARVKNSGASRAFLNTADWTERYDQGHYCHDAVGGGAGLSAEVYGETAIPAAYARREWPRSGLDVCEYVADASLCPQNVIVARSG